MATTTHPDRRIVTRSKRRLVIGLIIVISLLAAACGDSDQSTTTTASDTSERQAAAALNDGCADRSAMFDLINRATYAVVAEVDTPDGTISALVGTAWAVSERVLVTNAHITEFFVDFAADGVQFDRAVAVRSGTGEVVNILRGITHPDYTGDPFASPDVGLLTTQQVLPTRLTLAPENVDVRLAEEILLAGFPGDVEEVFRVIPGQSVPQATSLSGEITARRSHDPDQQVTADNLHVLQHQAPTTPGTSGSSVVVCNSVVGVNNAGTVRLVATPTTDGDLEFERQAASSNNFAVHVRFVHQLMDLFEDNAVQGFAIPVDATVQTQTTEAQPSGPIVLAGSVSADQARHDFAIQIEDDGTIVGVSEWPETGQFNLSGALQEDGTLLFVDDAPEQVNFRRGIYQGVVGEDGVVRGIYFEETREDQAWEWTARVN